MEPRTEPVAVDITELKTLSWVIEQAAGKKIVYVGEYHDRFSNHDVELQVIKDLFKKNSQIAIGMEMFQRPFQHLLDEYIGGAIHEREFLKRTEYFSRWGYDFNFYKPILDFARREKIPVVALNARTEIIHKVAEGGLTSLSIEEKEEIPGQMDLSDNTYRARLKRVFEKHKHFEEKNFVFFYEAQVLWDETMALSVDEYLRKNPLRQMIVVAGSGHLAYGSGIPKRAFRRSGHEYVTILSDADVDHGIADYLLFPKAREGVTAPVLMAVLKEQDNKVVITDFPADSPSGKAGLRVGDTILNVGGSQIRTIDDIKIELLYKQHGESVKVKVMRKRFLLRNSKLEFDVSLT
jgi:aminopeptidase N